MSKRSVEDTIRDVLVEDAQRNALDFVAYLRSMDIPLGDSENYWEVKTKDACVCYLLITGAEEAPGPWTIWSDQAPGSWATWGEGEHSRACADVPVDERTREIAWAHVNVCGNCGGCDNIGGTRKTVLGRGFDGLCNSTMAFTNPDAEALDCVKKMIAIRMGDLLREESLAFGLGDTRKDC